MKNINLFLFCGGLPIDFSGVPKPLMKVFRDKTLIKFYLEYLESKKILPDTVTLLYEVDQKNNFLNEFSNFKYPIPIRLLECEKSSSTFDKLLTALENHEGKMDFLHFSYPDIFCFGNTPQLERFDPFFHEGIAITVATLTSRFPRLIVDVYNNDIRGISNYASQMPANPLHVFGGDFWGREDVVRSLCHQFLEYKHPQSLSLEFDFLFWLINRRQLKSMLLDGDWLLVDSARDFRRLLNHLPNSYE